MCDFFVPEIISRHPGWEFSGLTLNSNCWTKGPIVIFIVHLFYTNVSENIAGK